MSSLEVHEAEQVEITAAFEQAVINGSACPHCARFRPTLQHGGCGQDDCVSRWFVEPTAGAHHRDDVMRARWLTITQSEQEIRTNGRRADEAAFLVQTMEAMTGVDETESAVQDMLTHLMHLCRMAKFDFGDLVSGAKVNFDAEVLEEPDWNEDDVHP